MGKEAKICGGATIWAREVLNSEIFLNKPDKWFKIWFYLVSRVSFKHTNNLERGEIFLQISSIMEKTGATKRQVEWFLKWAEEEEMISSVRKIRGKIYKINNYSKYQTLDNYMSNVVYDGENEDSNSNEKDEKTVEKSTKKRAKKSKNDVPEMCLECASDVHEILGGSCASDLSEKDAMLVEKNDTEKNDALEILGGSCSELVPNLLGKCDSYIEECKNVRSKNVKTVLKYNTPSEYNPLIAKFSILPNQLSESESLPTSEMAISKAEDPIDMALSIFIPPMVREIENKKTKEKREVSKAGYTTDEEMAINKLFKPFYELNRAFPFGNMTYRRAAYNIIKSYGFEEAFQLASLAVQAQSMPYAPVITNTIELQNKIGALRGFVAKTVTERSKGGITIV